MLRRYVRETWRRRRGMTSIPQTRDFLETQYGLLDALHLRDGQSSRVVKPTTAEPSSSRSQWPAIPRRRAPPSERLPHLRLPIALPDFTSSLLSHYSGLTPAAHPPPVRKPLLVGFLQPTNSIAAMPRLKPQPLALSMMIRDRHLRHEYRVWRQRVMQDWSDDMRHEERFWAQLGVEKRWSGLWQTEFSRMSRQISGSFERAQRRRTSRIGLGLETRVRRWKGIRDAWRRDAAVRRKAEEALNENGGGHTPTDRGHTLT